MRVFFPFFREKRYVVSLRRDTYAQKKITANTVFFYAHQRFFFIKKEFFFGLYSLVFIFWLFFIFVFFINCYFFGNHLGFFPFFARKGIDYSLLCKLCKKNTQMQRKAIRIVSLFSGYVLNIFSQKEGIQGVYSTKRYAFRIPKKGIR